MCWRGPTTRSRRWSSTRCRSRRAGGLTHPPDDSHATALPTRPFPRSRPSRPPAGVSSPTVGSPASAASGARDIWRSGDRDGALAARELKQVAPPLALARAAETASALDAPGLVRAATAVCAHRRLRSPAAELLTCIKLELARLHDAADTRKLFECMGREAPTSISPRRRPRLTPSARTSPAAAAAGSGMSLKPWPTTPAPISGPSIADTSEPPTRASRPAPLDSAAPRRGRSRQSLVGRQARRPVIRACAALYQAGELQVGRAAVSRHAPRLWLGVRAALISLTLAGAATTPRRVPATSAPAARDGDVRARCVGVMHAQTPCVVSARLS